jgi:hypothetical protein
LAIKQSLGVAGPTVPVTSEAGLGIGLEARAQTVGVAAAAFTNDGIFPFDDAPTRVTLLFPNAFVIIVGVDLLLGFVHL